MSRKIIFFDIDGTIIIEDTHIIPKSTVKAIKRARANGHLAFINTGRTFFNVTENIREIGFDGYVCGCGTYIHYKGETLLAKSLDHETCIEIIKKLRECEIEAVFESWDGVFFDQTKPARGELAQLKDQFGLQGFDVTKSWDDPDIVFDKFVVWSNEDSDFETFYSYITKDFDYIDRGNRFGEVVPKGYSKATGIKFLQEYFSIPLEDCYAIGDSSNDLSMLEYVPNSIAMGNSTPFLFDLVSFTTHNIEDDGIEYALAYYKII
ncbi:MAG: HAD family hydrolase [Clostridiaceae bacterium]|nr:HAD family hydrolase [Clostridiaceae bacterium]